MPGFPDAVAYENLRFPQVQLVIPKDASAPDFDESLNAALLKLAALERGDIDVIRRSLESTADVLPLESDLVAFSLPIRDADENSAPLQSVVGVLEQAEELLAASADLAMNRRTFHRGKHTAETNTLLQSARFNHTRRGSFVLTVSCPVVTSNTQLPLDLASDDGPTNRRAMLALARGMQRVAELSDPASAQSLVEATSAETLAPSISANLCDALATMLEGAQNEGVSIAISFAGLIPPPPDVLRHAVWQLNQSFVEPLRRVQEALTPPEKAPEIGPFVATVEGLAGDIGENDQREGLVSLQLFLTSGKSINVTAQLNATYYQLAVDAHKAGRSYVRIDGDLERRGTRTRVENVRAFAPLAVGAADGEASPTN